MSAIDEQPIRIHLSLSRELFTWRSTMSSRLLQVNRIPSSTELTATKLITVLFVPGESLRSSMCNLTRCTSLSSVSEQLILFPRQSTRSRHLCSSQRILWISMWNEKVFNSFLSFDWSSLSRWCSSSVANRSFLSGIHSSSTTSLSPTSSTHRILSFQSIVDQCHCLGPILCIFGSFFRRSSSSVCLSNIFLIDERTNMSSIKWCEHRRTFFFFSEDASPIRYHHRCITNPTRLCFRNDVYLCICAGNHTRVQCFNYDDQLFPSDLFLHQRQTMTNSLLILFSFFTFFLALPNNFFPFITVLRLIFSQWVSSIDCLWLFFSLVFFISF